MAMQLGDIHAAAFAAPAASLCAGHVADSLGDLTHRFVVIESIEGLLQIEGVWVTRRFKRAGWDQTYLYSPFDSVLKCDSPGLPASLD
jgi:hypothetical protein